MSQYSAEEQEMISYVMNHLSIKTEAEAVEWLNAKMPYWTDEAFYS